MTARVSIVVPAYNNADYLAETLDSILAQTYTDIEVVVADHASTDNTREIMAKYATDPRVVLLDTEAGGGAQRNWNRVSQAASGEYLKLVCGDDIIDPTLVEKQVAALDANDGAVLTACTRDIVDAHSNPVIRGRGLAGLHGRTSGGTAIATTVRQGTNIFGEPGCVMMRRDALEAAGWWDDRWPYLIDETSYARVLLQGDFVGIPESLAAFRISDTQWSVRLAKQQSEQAEGFHDWIRAERPDLVSAGDVRMGKVKARAMAVARRLTYVYLSRRMSK